MTLSLKRVHLVKLHLILSGLTLPIILLFFITGALETADISSSKNVKKWSQTQDTELIKNLGSMKTLARKELARKNIDVPLGKAKIKKDKKRKSFKLVWTGINHTLTVRPDTKKAKKARFLLETPSWHKRFWSLHKASGNDWFDVFVIVQSILLLSLVIVGVLIGLQVKLYRQMLLFSVGFGFLVFGVFMLLSMY